MMYSDNNMNNNELNEGKQSIKSPKNSNLGLIIGIVVAVLIIVVIGTVLGGKFLFNKITNLDVNKDDNNIINVGISENYIERQILYDIDVRYKLTTPTFLWDCNDNFGAAEIDTVLVASENGKVVENYYDIEDLSGVYFQTTDDVIASEASLKNKFKRWYGIDNIQVEAIEDDLFSRHIKGKTKSTYFESYCFNYDLYEDGETWTIYYSIELLLYKDNYDNSFLQNIINEYHTIIDTFEIVE